MSRIDGEAEDIRRRMQEIVREEVSDAVCELKDYAHRIGCGTMDTWGNIQEFVLPRSIGRECMASDEFALRVEFQQLVGHVAHGSFCLGLCLLPAEPAETIEPPDGNSTVVSFLRVRKPGIAVSRILISLE